MDILTSQVGINISENQIQLVEIVNKDNNIFLENIDEEYFDESISENTKEPKFITILQNSFNEIVLRKPLSSNIISISLPNSYFNIFEIPVDKNLTKNDLDDYVKWELSKLYPTKNRDYFAANKIKLNSINYQSLHKVLVYAIPNFVLKRIHKFCLRNNFILKLIDNAHTAVSPFIQSDLTSNNILSVHIENKELTSLFFYNGKPVGLKKNKLDSITQIPIIINEIINYFNLESEDTLKLYLSGNNVTSELKNNISTSSIITISEINPFRELIFSENLDENKFQTTNHSRFASVAGIALRRLS